MQQFLEMLKLNENERVLDVGCGIGGGDFYMAEKYGVFVHGVDLSVNMILIAMERASELKKNKVITCLHRFCLILQHVALTVIQITHNYATLQGMPSVFRDFQLQ